jgi:ferredoxin--NADP+ reductase
MVVDNKATVTYVQLLKEDLVIMRLVPKDGPVPDYKAGQFITLGLANPADNGKIVRRAYSIASHPENRITLSL